MTGQSYLVSERAISLIDRRLEDLAEANAIYGKDQRLNAPDKIARNEREISWLKDLRFEVVLIGHAPRPAGLIHPDVLMNVVQAKLNDYLELHNRGDLTEYGDHAWLALVNLQRDMEFALSQSSTDRLTAAPLDPETPECSICGARVFDPCRTLECAKYCQLPPGTSYSSPEPKP